MANPVLSDDILNEAVPGNIRKAQHFVVFLKKIVLYLKAYLNNAKQVENKTPLAFLFEMKEKSELERKPLRYSLALMSHSCITLVTIFSFDLS